MAEIPKVKHVSIKKSGTKHWYKNQLSRLRRRKAKQNPEEAGTRNRSYMGGWAD